MDRSVKVDRDKMALAVITAVSLALSRGEKVKFDISDGVFELRVDGLPTDFSERVAEGLSAQFGIEADLLDSL